jgi:hypothetical protein
LDGHARNVAARLIDRKVANAASATTAKIWKEGAASLAQ